MLIIIMGVSGSGKSTIGLLLATELNIPFADADDFHPAENLNKMTGGEALTDDDRSGWLQKLNRLLKEASAKKGMVMACSALREGYRTALTQDIDEKVHWVFLHGENTLLEQRISERKGHFMPSTLLQSQLKTLEKPAYGIHIDVAQKPEKIVEIIINKIKNDK